MSGVRSGLRIEQGDRQIDRLHSIGARLGGTNPAKPLCVVAAAAACFNVSPRARCVQARPPVLVQIEDGSIDCFSHDSAVHSFIDDDLPSLLDQQQARPARLQARAARPSPHTRCSLSLNDPSRRRRVVVIEPNVRTPACLCHIIAPLPRAFLHPPTPTARRPDGGNPPKTDQNRSTPAMPLSLLATYGTYLRGLLYFLRTGGDFAGCPFLQSDAELPTKVRGLGCGSVECACMQMDRCGAYRL